MKTSILAVAAFVVALMLFLAIVAIIVVPESFPPTDDLNAAVTTPAPPSWQAQVNALFSNGLRALGGLCAFALPVGLAIIARRRITKVADNLKGVAWANWALAMSVFGIITILLRYSTNGQVP